MTNRTKKRVLALVLAILIPLVGLPLLGRVPLVFLPRPGPDNEGYAIMLLKGFDDRNTATVDYFARVRGDAAKAAEFANYADEARALGRSIRKSLLVGKPAEADAAQFEKYTALQCLIASKADDDLKRSALWTKASYWRESYNRAAQSEMSTYERFFGSKRLVLHDCSP